MINLTTSQPHLLIPSAYKISLYNYLNYWDWSKCLET